MSSAVLENNGVYPLVWNKEEFVPKAGGCDHVISYTAVMNNRKSVAVWQKFDLTDAACMCLLELVPVVKLIW